MKSIAFTVKDYSLGAFKATLEQNEELRDELMRADRNTWYIVVPDEEEISDGENDIRELLNEYGMIEGEDYEF